MANFLANIAKGRVVEFYNRVKNNDPAPSAFILIPLSASGTQAQGEDLDDINAVLTSGFFTERTTGGWARKTLTDTQLAAFPAPDDVNNRYGVQVPLVTWTTPATGNNTTGLLMGYDADTGAGTDANIIFIGHWDFAVTTDGNDVQLNVGDFFRAA